MKGQSEPQWLSPDELDAWISLSWLMIKLPSEIDAQLQRDSGISFFEYLVLASLSMSPDRCLRMSDLAQHVNGSVTRLSNVAKRLEQRGWMRRAPSAENGRYIEATLTEAGMAVVKKAAPGHVAAVRRYVFDALRPDQVTELRDIGRQIAGQVEGEHTGMRSTGRTPRRL
ncbi:MarR family transcriptional regulator [Kibdelosporangium persicum]|uniref:Transcriptional repressor MprA n=1 Tax=Kibdelosporangium persicum TaxID=2698649 RepID=A0ABX2FAG2_9PSEU|nr:MarR family transcriptional regulator [Kibdelosporangium persicum]NRN67891.1 Transcriptional repressor MprA [Kibdelosporangium persicum]